MRRMAVRATIALMVAFVVTPAVDSATGAAASGVICTSVVSSWSGNSSIAVGQMFPTGVQVPAEIGVELSVEAFDVSTVDPAPGVLSVFIGDTPVGNSAAISGGEISVTNTGVAPVVLTRVEISVQRCFQVDAAPPVLSVPSSPVDLPATGIPSAETLVAAWSCVAAGAALLVARRRRTAVIASDHGR